MRENGLLMKPAGSHSLRGLLVRLRQITRPQLTSELGQPRAERTETS